MDLGRSTAGTDFYPSVYPGHFNPGAAGQVVALIGFILEGPSIVALVTPLRSRQDVRRNRKHERGGDKNPN